MRPTVLLVHGCVVALAAAGDRRAARCLTRAERSQCAALPGAAQRADYRAGRLAAKRAAAGPVGTAALRRVAVRRRPGGAPGVWVQDAGGGWRAADVALSLGHRDGRAIAAAATAAGCRVGVDVERAAAVPAGWLRYFATAAERAGGPATGAALWALKEAAWKALSLGADVPFAALALEFDGAGELAAVVLRGRRHPARAALLRPWRRHLAAVVVLEDA